MILTHIVFFFLKGAQDTKLIPEQWASLSSGAESWTKITNDSDTWTRLTSGAENWSKI